MSRLYRAILRLLPRDRRDRFGDQMALVFADQRRAATRAEAPVLWMKEITGVMRFSLREFVTRLRAWSTARRPAPRWNPAAELRWAWRGIRLRGWRALFITSMLAVALAANAVVFAAADAFVFRSAPYADAGRLAVIERTSPSIGVTDFLPVQVLEEWRRHPDLFAGVHAHQRAVGVFVTARGVTEIVRTAEVTPGLFDLLGVMPVWGRPFTIADRDDTSIVVISAALATRVFGRPADAVGQVLPSAGPALTIVGVMPASFHFPTALEEIWRPMDLARAGARTNVRNIARIAGAQSIETASTAFAGRAAAVGLVAPRQPMEPMTLRALGEARRHAGAAAVFPMLIGAALCLLLITCANVASLELAEATRRARVHAVQSALGAGRASLFRVVWLEGALMTTASVIVAFALASWGTAALGESLTPSMQTALVNPVDVDGRAWLFMALTAAAAWLLTSSPLLWRVWRAPLAGALRDDARVMPVTKGAARSRQLLMAGQIALTVLLLIGGLLYLRTYLARLGIDRGFDTSRLATIEVFPPPDSGVPAADLEREILTRLRAAPGVEAVSRTASLPPSTQAGASGQIHIDGRPAGEGRAMVSHFSIDPEYFDTVGVPVVDGRPLSASSGADEVVIDERFARRFWPGKSAIGHTFRVGSTRMGAVSEFRIVGLSKGFRADRTATDTGEDIYVSYIRLSPEFSPLRFVARLDDQRRAAALAGLVRAVASRVVVRTDTIANRYAQLDGDTRLMATIASGFGLLALVVATAGVYAVMAFLVSGRAREIGIRMALGADRGGVQRLIFGSSLRFVAAGASIGVIGAIAASRAIATQLFGVTATDPATYAAVAVYVIATALAATWWPARRAARVDPAVTLRAN
jgi:predicted permease